MAEVKSKSLLSYLDDSGKEYTYDYRMWQNKDEWKIVGGVRKRIQQMYNARQNSCYLFNIDNSKSWDKHWDLVEKDELMYTVIPSAEEWESNLKSSISYRTIAAIDSRERKQEIKFLVEARNEEDARKGKDVLHRYLFTDYFRRNPDIRYRFLEVSKSTKIFGTGIAFIPYTVRTREVQMPKDIEIDVEKMKGGEFPEIEFKSKTIVDFEDIDFVPWNLKDFYIDPNAQNLHGTNYAATDAAGILYLTASQVRAMFQGDPMVKNLDKIEANNREDYASPFYSPPKDIEKGYGELIYYYNVETDSEVIIYGDVLLKEGPIPYADKQIPFVAFRCVKHPGHFYGSGIVDAVIHQSAQDAAIKNARIEQVTLASNPPVAIGASIFGDVEEQWTRIEPGLLLRVGDVAQIRPIELPSVPFDSWRISEEMQDEAVMNTGINPQGLSLPMSSTPATNTLAMKENMADMVNMYSDNLMEGMNWWGYLLESRFCQYYWQPTRKAALELDKKEFRELRLEDIHLYQTEDGEYRTREIKGARIIPLEREMFEWTGSPRVYISPDFVSPLSSAFQQRKAQEILPQLAPFAGEPGQPMQNGAPAVINIRKLMDWYLDQMDVNDREFLMDEDEDRIEEIEQAQEQQLKMQDGETVPGVPGEPQAHRYTHAVELMKLNDTMSRPDFQMMLDIQEEAVQAIVMAMQNYRRELADHLRVDSLLANSAPDAAIRQSDAIDEAMQPQMPRNNAPTVPTVSGNQGLPNQGGVPVPNQMAPTDESGMGMI